MYSRSRRRLIEVVLRRKRHASSSSSSTTKKRVNPNPRIAIYASEVAAIVGQNPYRSMAHSLPSVLLRTFKEGTEVGDAIRMKGVKTEEERFHESLSRTGAKDLVEDALRDVKDRSSKTGSLGLEELQLEVESEMDEVIRKQPDEKRREEAKLVKDEIKSKMHQAYGTVQEDSALGNFEKSSLIREATNAIRNSMEELSEHAKLREDEKEKLKNEVSSAVKEKLESVSVEKAGDVDIKYTKDVWNDISRDVVKSKVMSSSSLDAKSKARFVNDMLPGLKSRLVREVPKSVVTGNNDKWYYRKIGSTERSGLKWGIGGRIDGFSHGKLVEVKNRIRRIPKTLPKYDMIQVQTYMNILKLPECVVLQRLKNSKDTSSELNVKSWDRRTWSDRVESRLQTFVDFVDQAVYFDDDESTFLDEVTRMELFEALASAGVGGKSNDKNDELESIVRSVFTRFLQSRYGDDQFIRF